MTDLAKNIWLHAIAIVAKARNKCAPGERFEALNLVMGDLEDARRRDQLIAPDFPAACPDCGQHCETHNGESDCAALQPGEARGADPVARLVEAARAEADKAMRKYPQPNYVISKVAEEAGEVVKAAIHCAEGRETPEAVIGEIKQAMAMLIRLYIEGDQVHGLPPLAAMEASDDRA